MATASAALFAQSERTESRYIRYRKGTSVSYGILDGETIRQLQGDLFTRPIETGVIVRREEVQLLYPCLPPKVLAVGQNYKSHLGNLQPPQQPEIFYKPISCLNNPDDPIVIPATAKNVHYEGELVIVIGKQAVNVTEKQAPDFIFGYTCGNDVSERDWQNGPQKDMQWWRAKGTDTFGPLGPVIVRRLDFGKAQLQTRLNGKVVQKQYISDMLFGPAAIVSFVSRFVTLTPGDVIFTGTPGSTSRMSPGDVCEVEIDGIGILRNKVAGG
jgi:2-keto-4-pentenoate hydratase/2-oxohepta-3-ene-1,7-dioic acid hydratase in catechol pathway